MRNTRDAVLKNTEAFKTLSIYSHPLLLLLFSPHNSSVYVKWDMKDFIILEEQDNRANRGQTKRQDDLSVTCLLGSIKCGLNSTAPQTPGGSFASHPTCCARGRSVGQRDASLSRLCCRAKRSHRPVNRIQILA